MRGTKARAKFKPRRVQREDNRSDAGKISTEHGNGSRDKSRIKNPIESRRKRLFVEDEALRRDEKMEDQSRLLTRLRTIFLFRENLNVYIHIYVGGKCLTFLENKFVRL